MYMVMFNEANVCNILETILFGSAGCEALEDAAVDLVDYTLRHLTLLCSGQLSPENEEKGLKESLEGWKPGDELPQLPEESIEAELNRLQREVTFQVRGPFWRGHFPY